MAQKHKNVSGTSETEYIKEARQRVFSVFAKEHQDAREAIVRDIQAYNALLNLKATTFEEMVLMQICEEKGLPPHMAHTLVPECPFCGSDEQVRRKEDGIYLCKACSTPKNEVTFAPNYNSITSDAHKEAITWMKLLHCMFSYVPMTKALDLIGITKTSYFRMRNKVFYAMRLLLDGLEDGSGDYGVKLSGIVQVDNTYTRASFKGMSLESEADQFDFPEDSIFFDDTFLPRPARKNGRPNKMSERSANSITIFTAIDDRGRVLARYAGTGATSLKKLRQFVPESKFLKEVPDSLPFEKIAKQKDKAPETKPGDKTLIVADKELALASYANYLGVDFEPHVYRKNGTQWKLAPGSHNIQRVNALHSRLKKHLMRCGYASTKYLPGILTQFEIMENFDQDLAIKELFKILTKQNLGKPPGFFTSLFTTPDFLGEWIESNDKLSRFPYSKLLAFYLYDCIRQSEDYPDIPPGAITMDYIEEVTSYARSSIRRFYAALCKAGYRPAILEYFGEPVKVTKNKIIVPKPSKRKKEPTQSSYPPEIFTLYDDYEKNMQGVPWNLREHRTFDEWRIAANQKYGTNYSFKSLEKAFIKIRKQGLRKPIDKTRKRSRYGECPSQRNVAILLDYEALERSYRQKGEKPPSILDMRTVIGEKYSLAPRSVGKYVDDARAYRRRHPDNFATLVERLEKTRVEQANNKGNEGW